MEILISDPEHKEASVTTINNGDLFIESDRSGNSEFYLLQISRNENGIPSGNPGKYEKITLKLPQEYQNLRVVRPVVSPGNSKIAFELTKNPWEIDQNTYIFYADFNMQVSPPVINNLKLITPSDKNYLTIYPKWSKSEKSIVYTSSEPGKLQFYKYDIETGKTTRITRDNNADYSYFCADSTPN